jgi:hypothetical protein
MPWVTDYLKSLRYMFPTLNESKINISDIFSKPILNSGVIAGGITVFLRHLAFMQKMYDPRTLKAFGTDQGFINLCEHA